MQKQALISVSDKTNIEDIAQYLVSKNYKIISTGGTFKYLQEKNIPVTEVNTITNFPEILDGRVKTLHPSIHGGILARRDKESHLQTLSDYNLATIDVVIVNLYPFFENANKDLPKEDLVEFIDIGGPTMLRAAAKSYFDVTVITEPKDYNRVMEQMSENGETELAFRQELAGKVFNLTSAYDGAIAKALLKDSFPKYYTTSYRKKMDLRYGENPHQGAAFYENTTDNGAMKDFLQHQGKALSFNNIRDMDLAWKVVNEFEEICCCAVKHSTPCGVALDEDVFKAYLHAYECDPISIFGGIVAFNTMVTEKLVEKMNEIFLEIVMAPSFEPAALALLKKKKNLRVIEITNSLQDTQQMVQVDGGLLVQDKDLSFSTDFEVVSKIPPTSEEMEDLIFAQKVIKHVKSNAIVVANNRRALGVGTGQTNRIWAAKEAVDRAKEKETEGLVMASDAFFPFRDVVDFAAAQGIKAIVQPGGSIKDNDSIDAANEHQISMVFTGMRHFLH